MSETWSVTTPNAGATRALAKRLCGRLALGQVVALVGELGAGKTTFVQGLAQGWGVAETSDVLSPTYTLVNEYPAERGLLVHVDLYRLEDVASARALGLEEQLARRDALVVVEWADKMPELFGDEAVWIRFGWSSGGGRRLSVEGIRRP